MNVGDKLICPYCREATVVKRKPKMRGWTRIGDALVCALCGAELGTPPAAGDAPPPSSAARALAALLGETEKPSVRLDPGSEYRRFCRNCRNRIEHPFVLRCARNGGAIEPGGCCEFFEPEEPKI